MKWAIGEYVKSLADKKQIQATKSNCVAKQSKTHIDEVWFAMQATGCGTKLGRSRTNMFHSDDVMKGNGEKVWAEKWSEYVGMTKLNCPPT